MLGNTLDANLEEAENIVLGDLAVEFFLVGLEPLVDRRNDAFPSLLLLDVAVDAFLDEDFLKGSEMPLFI